MNDLVTHVRENVDKAKADGCNAVTLKTSMLVELLDLIDHQHGQLERVNPSFGVPVEDRIQ